MSAPDNSTEWEAMQEVIKTHPDTIKAVRHLKAIAKVMDDYIGGLILATEATDNIQEILKK